MAYEAFPSDAVEAFNDPGIYYVHENGKLRSPPGLGHSLHTTAFSESGLPKLSPFDIGESTSDGGTCFVPRSLFQQTINFVARNLWRVESLVGFPDIVGKQLFDVAQSQGIFTNKQLRLSSLRLFVEAYDIEILSSLNLKRKPVTLEDFAGEIMLFSGLLELELGGCSLGEEHEMWSHIGSMPGAYKAYHLAICLTPERPNPYIVICWMLLPMQCLQSIFEKACQNLTCPRSRVNIADTEPEFSWRREHKQYTKKLRLR